VGETRLSTYLDLNTDSLGRRCSGGRAYKYRGPKAQKICFLVSKTKLLTSIIMFVVAPVRSIQRPGVMEPG